MLDVLKIIHITVLHSPQSVTAAVVLMAANHFTGTEAELLWGCLNSAQNFLRRIKRGKYLALTNRRIKWVSQGMCYWLPLARAEHNNVCE